MQPRTRDERSLGELFSELSRETGALVRQEVALAKAEMTQKAAQVGKDVGLIAIGGAVAYAGFLALIATCVVLLNLALNILWLSALIVTIVVLGLGSFLIHMGLDQLKKGSLAPTKTINSLKDGAQWAKEQVQ